MLEGGEGMEIVAVAASIVAIYFAIKYFAVKLSMMAYIYWMEEEKRTQPTRSQLDACKKKILSQMFR